MSIIQQKGENTNNFWLHFYINGEGGEFLDYDLPHPNYHKHFTGKGGYAVAWLIDGFFHTTRGNDYLNDCIARFLITFKDHEPRRLAYKPQDLKTKKILTHTYRLKQISNQLESIKTHKKAPTRADSFADSTFWAIKLFCEDEIRLTGFIVYDTLERWALEQFVERKEKSTIRAKCRSVWNYYSDRDFKLNQYEKKPKEETLAARQEHIKQVHKTRTQQTEAKILGAITSLNFMQEKISATNLAKYTQLSRETIYQYKTLWQ